MTKNEFLKEVSKRFKSLDESDRQKGIDYCCEIIDDMTEDGLSEEEAVASLGGADRFAESFLSELAQSKGDGTQIAASKKRKLATWEILLLVLGSPLWLSLILAAAAILMSIYITIWSVVLSFAVTDLALALSGVASIGCAIVYMVLLGGVNRMIFLIGAGLALIGVSIFMYYLCKWLFVAAVKLSKGIFIKLKNSLERRELDR